MIRVVFLGVVMIAVGAVLTAFVVRGEPQVTSSSRGRFRRRVPRLPRGIFGLLAVAFVASVILAATAGDGWALLPIALWLVVFLVMWWRVMWKPRGARDTDSSKKLGAHGTELVERAESAVGRIRSSAAAEQGWLGVPADLDFRADLIMIVDNLVRAAALREVMDELSALSHATVDDQRLLAEARTAVQKMEQSVRMRVATLENCADEAGRIDRSLRDEEERMRTAQRRDDARFRLRGMLAGAELAGDDPPSDRADALTARVEAYHELKGMIHQQRLGDELGGDRDGASKWLRDNGW